MSKKANKTVPKLRFPEFEGDWKISTIEEIASVSSGGTPSRTESTYWNGDIPWVTTSEISQAEIFDSVEKITRKGLENSSAKLFKKNTILIAMYGQGKTRGQVSILRIEATTNQACAAITLFDAYSPEFIYYFLSKEYEKLRLLSNDGSQKNLSAGLIKQYKVSLTSIAEQKKIASFLEAVDTRLTQLRCKHKLLQTYKQGVMQKIFSQQIRLKSDDGKPFPDWEKKKFSQVFERITRKNKENNLNTLTISAQHGLINQRDFFNKSVSADDLTGYYLLKRGDFAYNKSYSNGYPMGAIKRLKFYEKGVVSTLYICFSTKNEVEAQFYEKYFEGGFLNHELSKIAQEGARNHGLLNMSVVEFFQDITLDYPTIEEQAKITDFLTAIDKKIEAVAKQIDLTEQFKKGLLQKMFV
ncbi:MULTISPECIES: restriction endonuclease subunit S [unclassified Microcoleus]|uniref:restriction endonuclease subunit S n=1 Tax=unclassified Microcoleus TaxID=2642155 RepID=UPI002FD18373